MRVKRGVGVPPWIAVRNYPEVVAWITDELGRSTDTVRELGMEMGMVEGPPDGWWRTFTPTGIITVSVTFADRSSTSQQFRTISYVPCSRYAPLDTPIAAIKSWMRHLKTHLNRK